MKCPLKEKRIIPPSQAPEICLANEAQRKMHSRVSREEYLKIDREIREED